MASKMIESSDFSPHSAGPSSCLINAPVNDRVGPPGCYDQAFQSHILGQNRTNSLISAVAHPSAKNTSMSYIYQRKNVKEFMHVHLVCNRQPDIEKSRQSWAWWSRLVLTNIGNDAMHISEQIPKSYELQIIAPENYRLAREYEDYIFMCTPADTRRW